ncbi:AMP-binding protein [Streptomyces mirabilis]|uniref:AMP-binding protein n=1 Tax=Streptomyces mirabilis TaxID=68239 RepID=UPI00379E000E
MHLGWQAKQRPDAIAVIESGGRTVTYAELDARSRQLAAAFGLRPGDAIAIRMPSGAAYLEVAWAAQRSGLLYSRSTPISSPPRSRRWRRASCSSPRRRTSACSRRPARGSSRSARGASSRSLAEAGIPLAAGTDAPYGSADPWAVLRAAVERSGGEAVARRAALDLFAGEPQHASRVRRLAGGSVADLCLLHVPLKEALDLMSADVVRVTFVGGRRSTPPE